MSVTLTVRDAGSGRVGVLPHRYVVARFGTYVHLPRSASRHEGRLYVTAMCGQGLCSPILTDDPVGPHCGTCHGRALGHDPTRPDLIWRPRGMFHLPPRWCPGPNAGLWVATDDRTSACRCLFCGTEGKGRGMGGAYRWHWQMQKHEHRGQGITCPDHGWKHLRSDRDGVVWCTSDGCDAPRPRPFWLIVPHGTPPPYVEPPPELTEIEARLLGAYDYIDVPVRRKRGRS